MSGTDRYARQRLIGWWDQDRLRAARVLVAGAGALGNEVLKNLALLGVGNLVVIDFDRVERSNLSRTVLFRETDVARPKVEAAADALARINPEVRIQAIDGDLFYDVGLGHYRHSQLAVGCLDNLGARSQVGLSCALAGIPHLDGGMWSLGGEARWFTAGDGPCFTCTLAEDDRRRMDERRSCTGFHDPGSREGGRVPTLATTAAVVGGLLSQEVAKWLCGRPIAAGRSLVYNGEAVTLHRAELQRNSACLAGHSPLDGVIELPRRAAELSARELLALARADAGSLPSPADDLLLELGRDFLVAFHCDACGRSQEMKRPQGQVLESEQTCPQCGAVRRGEVLRSLDEANGHADWPLAALGVPPGEVVAVRVGSALRFYELTADIRPSG